MNFLGLEEFSRNEILKIIELSRKLTPPIKGKYLPPPLYQNALTGYPIALLFFEPSTRTRASFELAVHHLGGYPLTLPLDHSSLKKGETLLDTCLNLHAMGTQCFVIRHSSAELLTELADTLEVPLINAGAGHSEHPTQGLLDIRTLQEALNVETFEGKKIAILGDIAHSRVARSTTIGLSKLGATIRLAGPPELLPKLQSTESSNDILTTLDHVSIVEQRDEAIQDADAVIMLRVQKERFASESFDTDTYASQWRIDQHIVDNILKPHVPILHPGPVVRGEELSSEVVDGPQSHILKQVRNGVAIRQAVLLTCLSL